MLDVGVIGRVGEEDEVPQLGNGLGCLGTAEETLDDGSDISHELLLLEVVEVVDVTNHLLNTLEKILRCRKETYVEEFREHVHFNQLIFVERMGKGAYIRVQDTGNTVDDFPPEGESLPLPNLIPTTDGNQKFRLANDSLDREVQSRDGRPYMIRVDLFQSLG